MMKARTAYFLLIFLCIGLFLPGLSSLPIMDRDESHFAQATRQMMESGNYFSTQFLNITRHQKSPGINWLQAASVEIFSHSESNSLWPYRLPSFLGALASVLLLFYFAKDIFDEKTAFLASALLASCVLLILEAHIAVIDACLLATVIAMQGALWKIYSNETSINKDLVHPAPPSSRGSSAGSIFAEDSSREQVAGRRRWWAKFFESAEKNGTLIFWLALSTGFFLKGLPLLIAFFTISVLCIADRSIRWLKNLNPISGLALFIFTTLLWVIPTSYANHGNYLLQLFQRDLLPKLLHGMESHGAPPGYYLLTFSLLFFPGSLFVGYAIFWAWKNKAKVEERFLIAWIVPTWLFLSLMPTKLPQYVLPLFPAIALLSARGILNISWAQSTRIFRGFQYFQMVFWLAIGIGIALLPFFLGFLVHNTLPASAIAASSVLIFSLILALLFFWAQKYYACLFSAIVGVGINFATLSTLTLPSMNNFWLSQKIVHSISEHGEGLISDKTPLITIDYDEPSLAFYLGTHKIKLGSSLNKPNPYLISDEKLQSIQKEGRYRVKIITKASAYNYSLGEWETYYVVIFHPLLF